MNALKRYMKEKGLTQKEIARIVDVSQAAVSKHMAGMGMNLTTALRYHERLGIPLDELIPEKTDKDAKNQIQEDPPI